MLNSVRKRPKQLMRSHLKLALSSFDELTEAYNELEINIGNYKLNMKEF